MSQALWALYQRQTMRLAGWQLWQTILGLLIPLLLVGHVMGTRGLHSFTAFHGDYITELTVFWILAPVYGVLQVVVLIVVWLHASLGIHGWLRLKPWYAARQTSAFTIARYCRLWHSPGSSPRGCRCAALPPKAVGPNG